MFSKYAELFAISGTKRVASAGFIARMPIAMDTLAIIYFINSVDGRYSVAGSITAFAALITVISSPIWSKIADRYGQRIVISITFPVRVIAFAIFILLVRSETPVWSWFLAIFLAESASISFGSMTRRRWIHLIGSDRRDLLSTSYAFESLLDEFIYIFGPLITSIVVATFSPVSGLLLGMILLLIGAPLLASHHASDPGVEEGSQASTSKSIFLNKKLQAVGIPLTIAGGSFTAVNIGVVAFSDEYGVKMFSGLLLGIWALGGATSALINGAINWKISHGSRYLIYLAGMTAISLSFPFIGNVYLLGLALFLQGLCIAPLLPNGLPLVVNSVPPSQMTQAITLVTAGIPLTGAISSFLSGRIIDNFGANAGLWLPFSFLLVALIATIPYRNYYRD